MFALKTTQRRIPYGPPPPVATLGTLNFQQPGIPGSMHSRVAREYLASGATRA